MRTDKLNPPPPPSTSLASSPVHTTTTTTTPTPGPLSPGQRQGTEDPEAAAAAAAELAPSATTTTPSSSLPNKWRPWKVVLGCFLLTVPTYGLLSAIGLFQTYWRAGLLAGRSEADVAWLTSLFGFLDCLFAAPAGYLFDRTSARAGAWRLLLAAGCAAYAAAFVGLAFCETYAGFVGCVVVAGIAAGG